MFMQFSIGFDEFFGDPSVASFRAGRGAGLHHLLKSFVNRYLERLLADDFGQTFWHMKIIELNDASRIW